MSDPIIREFLETDIDAVRDLADQEIGKNYFETSELVKIQKDSIKNGINCSFVLDHNGSIQAFRLTLPPGQWSGGKGVGLSLDKISYEFNELAYFQSLFVQKNVQGQGFGRALSLRSIEALKKLNTSGILCHSWKESPGQSSFKYLTSMGFKQINEHKHYWRAVDYVCPRCGKPCLCTAQEMFLDLQN